MSLEIDLNNKKGNDKNKCNDNSNIISNFLKELSKSISGKNITYVIDRFEGNIAICEDRETKKMHDIDLDKLPKGSKEGNVLIYNNGRYELDKETEKEVSDRIKNKMDNLWK